MKQSGSIVIFVCLVSISALSIEKVSDQNNVTKRAAGDFYPDWVPFKNKHGEELGEFISVAKAKPKKRLAPPVNFVLRAVAEPEGDDYYDKGQGESDSDDYYEKKEWSDLNRPVNTKDSNTQLNHTDISEIDGVVDIITKSKPSIILSALQNNTNIDEENVELSKEKSEEKTKEEKVSEEVKSESNEKSDEKQSKKENQDEKYEDDVDYEEANVDNKKPELTEEEQKENDEKKARILGSVDELKARHAEEQRAISEKAKEEEILQEEFERNNLNFNSNAGKYDNRNVKKVSDYDEYNEKESFIQEKYPIKSTTRKPKKSKKRNNRNKNEEQGKLSVFKNPHSFIAYDNENSASDEITTRRPTKSRSYSRSASRSTSTSAPEEEENTRISLVPQDTNTKEGEPTLFFPKIRKNKRRRNHKTSTTAPDSYVAETVEDAAAKGLITTSGFPVSATAPDTTGSTGSSAETAPSAVDTGPSGGDTAPSGSATAPSSVETTATAESGPSGLDTLSTNTNAVTDAVPASSDHKGHEKEKKPENYHNEKGGGREYHSKHSEEHSEHGKKAYQGQHEDSKTAKGHHDKESHHGKYFDEGGHDKHHHEESGHYGHHDHEEHGKKQAKYEESGKHSKGHSTKGSHDIHKKEEYEKKVEFFEEDGDSAEEEKHGGYHDEKQHKKGGHYKKANFHAGHHAHQKGNEGHFQKGGHAHGHKGHSSAGGKEGHGKHLHAHHNKAEKEGGKKWVYHHGYPAKTSNLVIIDRRADQLYHGPQYYG